MARQRQSDTARSRRRPARTPEAREAELSGLAYDLAAEQLDNGTASSQVITHFLKAASTREQLEQQRIQHEIELMEVKKEEMEGRIRIEELFTNAIRAFKGYSGQDPAELEEGDGEF